MLRQGRSRSGRGREASMLVDGAHETDVVAGRVANDGVAGAEERS